MTSRDSTKPCNNLYGFNGIRYIRSPCDSPTLCYAMGYVCVSPYVHVLFPVVYIVHSTCILQLYAVVLKSPFSSGLNPPLCA